MRWGKAGSAAQGHSPSALGSHNAATGLAPEAGLILSLGIQTPASAVSAPGAVPAPGPLPRSGRAVMVPGGGLIGRVVAWLSSLAPRRKRAPLPRARTRLARPDGTPGAARAAAVAGAAVASPDAACFFPSAIAGVGADAAAGLPAASAPAASEVVRPSPHTPAAPQSAAADDSLSRRMLVALSEENSRLRSELASLRAQP